MTTAEIACCDLSLFGLENGRKGSKILMMTVICRSPSALFYEVCI
jgi:hypothetical protein